MYTPALVKDFAAAAPRVRERPKVMVVDDDPGLQGLCQTALEPVYDVVSAENGSLALRLLYQHRPDLILLDISMPILDGWQTLRRIRELTDTPVMMLTAFGGDEDVVRGLDSGADDYVTKPFSPAQLAARMRAVLRRRAGTEDQSPVIIIDEGRLLVDTLRRVAVVRGQEVTLSATEYRLLELLARHPGQVLTHEQILEHVWGPGCDGEYGYVKTYIGLLRGKIEELPHRPSYILARRGLGYYLDRRSRPLA